MGKNVKFQLYQWVTTSTGNILDCKVINYGAPSDHRAIKLKLKFENRVRYSMKTTNNINRNLLLDDDIKHKFNEKTTEITKELKFDLNYD